MQVCFPRIIVVLSISAAATNRIGYLLLKSAAPAWVLVSDVACASDSRRSKRSV